MSLHSQSKKTRQTTTDSGTRESVVSKEVSPDIYSPILYDVFHAEDGYIKSTDREVPNKVIFFILNLKMQ